jgi:saposin
LCHATCDGHNQYSEGIVDIEPSFVDNEVPCKLCEQLMLHLREVFIANTTELEFKNILEGFCTQVPKITDECISITEQYYDQIYKFLMNGLDASKTCVIIGVCAGGKVYKSPSMPLLSGEAFPPLNHKSVEIIYDENSIKLQGDGKWCTACEYAMNFIHEEMGKNTVNDKIVEYARKSCKILPKFVKQCEETMDTFGDEIANAIYHSTDPRLICPAAKLCPPNFDVDSLEKNAVGEKPSCSFCLFAIQEIKDVIQSNNSRDNIEKALDKLCDHLSENLKAQCVSFVKSHSADVIDMMLANFTPQEACVFIKLCNKNEPVRKRVGIVKLSKSSESNESSGEF